MIETVKEYGKDILACRFMGDFETLEEISGLIGINLNCCDIPPPIHSATFKFIDKTIEIVSGHYLVVHGEDDFSVLAPNVFESMYKGKPIIQTNWNN